LVWPWAQRRTIRHRIASACDELCRRAHRSSVLRSSPLSSISTAGRPRLAIALPPMMAHLGERGPANKIPGTPTISYRNNLTGH
jgi:hypothetical protein